MAVLPVSKCQPTNTRARLQLTTSSSYDDYKHRRQKTRGSEGARKQKRMQLQEAMTILPNIQRRLIEQIGWAAARLATARVEAAMLPAGRLSLSDQNSSRKRVK
jgi:hypothetical protein